MTTATLNQTEKVTVREIVLYRAEGVQEEAQLLASRLETGGNIWKVANKVLKSWAATAPTLGYHKVKYTVIWSNGDSYSGQYDLKWTDLLNADFAKDVRSGIMFYVERPVHIKEDLWNEIINDSDSSAIEFHKRMAASLDLGL